MWLRRQRARRILKTCGDTWPINEAAGKQPDNWPGWPDGKQFALVLTHDVESQKGLDQVRQLAELEMELGFRSSFNFIPEGEYQVPKELREWLVENGFEVGVHDLHHDGHLYSSQKRFRKKAKCINHYLKEWGATGFRSGFMLRELDWLHDLDITYDASTFDTDPFEPQPNGTNTIFPFIVSDGSKSYVELPYTLPQDSTLFFTLEESSPEIWKRKLDWIADRGGMVLVNIHPDYVNFGSSDSGQKNESGATASNRDMFSLKYPVIMIQQFISCLNTDYHDAYWNPLPSELAEWYVMNPGRNTPVRPNL